MTKPAIPDDAAEAVRRLLKVAAEAVAPPPMPYRRQLPSSFRIRVETKGKPRSVIATCRKMPARSRKEARVLTVLNHADAPAPRLLAYDGAWLIQEDLGHHRLSQLLDGADPVTGERLVDDALRALGRCQQAGNRGGLQNKVPLVDGRKIQLGGAAAVAELLGMDPPPLPEAIAASLDAAPRRHFIKWDARPGNAIVTEDGRTCWIDWEHACRGEPLEDVVWLLCDEWLPDWPQVEQRLIRRHLGSLFGNDPDGRHHTYFTVFAVLHMTVRLQMILRRKGDGPWWRKDACLEHDLLGVTRDTAVRLARRAARWAGASPATGPLAPWLGTVAARLDELE